jgi:small subunit ribosomal protein S17
MPKRILQGVALRDARDKTVIVRVERRVMHPVYKKFIMRSKNYAAHDENNVVKAGDVLRIEESRPISRRKRWVALFDGGAQPAPAADEAAAPAPVRKAKVKPRAAAKARASKVKKKASSRAKAGG